MSAGLPELELEDGAALIADLHLDLANPGGGAAFVGWLAGLVASGTPRLLILGDLFDAWVGPAHARLAGAPPVLDALAAATRAGTAVAVVPGNRDFLLGASFERRTGARLFPDGLVGLAGGARVLLVHGDELCTLDRGYQRLRRVVRSRAVRWLAPRLPDALALSAARRLRRASVRAVASKPSTEKAQQPEACRALAARHAAETVVCGHAHAFRDERLPAGPRWIVLDAFGGPRDVLRFGPRGALRVEASGVGGPVADALNP